MKIKKLIVPVALTMAMCSCAIPVARGENEASEVASAKISDNSKIGKIAQEIGIDNYMRGKWASLDFTYEVRELASVGASIQYYAITFEYQRLSGKERKDYYIKVSGSEWEIMREEG